MRSNWIIAAVAAALTLAPAAVAVAAHGDHGQKAAPQSADGVGVIKAINTAAGTVTIDHEPIAALRWPAMNMTFKVASPNVLKGVTVGRKVHFELVNQNGKPIVTAIHPM